MGRQGGWQTGASAEVDAVEPFELFFFGVPALSAFFFP
jgi:hypothetical protein